VTPFCHPFHEYPRDFRRFTVDGLKQLCGGTFETIAEGWRTGPTATMLVFTLEYVKLWFPGAPGASSRTAFSAGYCFRCAISTSCS
jgi:hypothetical protein